VLLILSSLYLVQILSGGGSGGGGSAGPATVTISRTLDGNGAVLDVYTSAPVFIPNTCTITQVVLDADQVGSLNVIVEKATYTTGTPTYTTISSGLALSSARSLKDSTLTGWSTGISPNSLVRFSITATATFITKAGLTLVMSCS